MIRTLGKNDFSGWLESFGDWLDVAKEFYWRWAYQKVKIENPHDERGLTCSIIKTYLRHNDVR